MKRVLLTGADGNLGSALQVAGSKIKWLPLRRGNWDQLETLMSKAEVVLHAASDLRTPVSDSPTKILNSNVMTTAMLLEAARKYRVPRFVFISSCAVYGQSQITSESTPLSPISVNGLCKALGEKTVSDFCSTNGMQWEIYRIFNSYGNKDHFSIFSHLQKSLATGRPFVLNNDGLSLRDFVHIDDVANILIQLLDKRPESKCLNIGSGQATRIADIVSRVRVRFPDLPIQPASRYETEYSRADISRLHSLIGNYRFRDVLDFVEKDWQPDLRSTDRHRDERTLVQ